MTPLHKAYPMGASAAHAAFEKIALSDHAADILTGVSGAIPIPLLAALTGAAVSDKGDRFAGGAGAEAGRLIGGIGGGVTGAVGGTSLGALLGALAKHPGTGAAIGGNLGAVLGTFGGAGYGAYKGRRLAVD